LPEDFATILAVIVMFPPGLILAFLAEHVFFYIHSAKEDLGLYGLYRQQMYARIGGQWERFRHGMYIAFTWSSSSQEATLEPSCSQEAEQANEQSDDEYQLSLASNLDAGRQASLFPPPYSVRRSRVQRRLLLC
jgi:hypothetical protein